MSSSRRIGRFMIPCSTIENCPEEAMTVLRGCLIIRAEARFDCRSIEYIALSEAFDEVPCGQEAPLYAAEMRNIDGKPTFGAWRRM